MIPCISCLSACKGEEQWKFGAAMEVWCWGGGGHRFVHDERSRLSKQLAHKNVVKARFFKKTTRFHIKKHGWSIFRNHANRGIYEKSECATHKLRVSLATITST
eukprot:189436-Hanusia_phi.AAC.3